MNNAHNITPNFDHNRVYMYAGKNDEMSMPIGHIVDLFDIKGTIVVTVEIKHSDATGEWSEFAVAVVQIKRGHYHADYLTRRVGLDSCRAYVASTPWGTGHAEGHTF